MLRSDTALSSYVLILPVFVHPNEELNQLTSPNQPILHVRDIDIPFMFDVGHWTQEASSLSDFNLIFPANKGQLKLKTQTILKSERDLKWTHASSMRQWMMSRLSRLSHGILTLQSEA
jgi:hypothetical protein